MMLRLPKGFGRVGPLRNVGFHPSPAIGPSISLWRAGGEARARQECRKSPAARRNRPGLPRQPGEPQRSACAECPWRSDAGNGAAAAGAGRIGCVIAVLHPLQCCRGMTCSSRSQYRVLHCCSILEGVDLVPRAAIRIVAPERLDSTQDRGRDAHYWAPPAQIRTSPIRASGSYLGCLTAKRCSGQG